MPLGQSLLAIGTEAGAMINNRGAALWIHGRVPAPPVYAGDDFAYQAFTPAWSRTASCTAVSFG